MIKCLASAGWGLALLLVTGCTTTRITNLTPSQAPRSADGLYAFEARWDSDQRAIRPDSFTPFVVVNMQFYPMQRVALTTNRWEALVPLPDDRRFVNYHFKFDYQYNSFPRPRRDSRMSQTYQLEITRPMPPDAATAPVDAAPPAAPPGVRP